MRTELDMYAMITNDDDELPGEQRVKKRKGYWHMRNTHRIEDRLIDEGEKQVRAAHNPGYRI